MLAREERLSPLRPTFSDTHLSTSRPRDANVRLALLLAILIFVPLLLGLFVLELVDVVLIWIVTRTTRSLPIVWALALMFLLLVVVLGMGHVFSRSVESVATNRPDPPLEELRITYARSEITERSSEHVARLSKGNPGSP